MKSSKISLTSKKPPNVENSEVFSKPQAKQQEITRSNSLEPPDHCEIQPQKDFVEQNLFSKNEKKKNLQKM